MIISKLSPWKEERGFWYVFKSGFYFKIYLECGYHILIIPSCAKKLSLNQLFLKWPWLNQPLKTKMPSILFTSVSAIRRFTLEKHHPKWCSSGFALVFRPLEYSMGVLEFYFGNKPEHWVYISVFYQRNLVSSTTSQSVGSASASWGFGNIKHVVNHCTVTDPRFLTRVLLLHVYLLVSGVEGLSLLCGVYAWSTCREARDGLDTGWSRRQRWEGSDGYRTGTAHGQPGCSCIISAARESFEEEFRRDEQSFAAVVMTE